MVCSSTAVPVPRRIAVSAVPLWLQLPLLMYRQLPYRVLRAFMPHARFHTLPPVAPRASVSQVVLHHVYRITGYSLRRAALVGYNAHLRLLPYSLARTYGLRYNAAPLLPPTITFACPLA